MNILRYVTCVWSMDMCRLPMLSDEIQHKKDAWITSSVLCFASTQKETIATLEQDAVPKISDHFGMTELDVCRLEYKL